MEVLIIIAVILGAIYLFKSTTNETDQSGDTRTRDHPSSPQNPTNYEANKKIFKSSSNNRVRGRTKSKIRFNDPLDGNQIIICGGCGKKLRVPSGRIGTATCKNCNHKNQVGSNVAGGDQQVTRQSFEGIVDAFTGLSINFDSAIYTCKCGAAYQQESYNVLVSENDANCVACKKPNISLYKETLETFTEPPRNYDPSVVSLSNYKSFVNSVVTFEGKVERVQQSRRGLDYAVMFENKSWVEGFKLVFFKGSVRKVGGYRYINSLLGKTIKVRGLLIKHERFGYEIIINDKSMILSEKI